MLPAPHPSELNLRQTGAAINELPLVQYDGPIVLVRDAETWEQAEAAMRADGVLGFDTETRPSFRKGKRNSPAVLQLASAGAVYLLQLNAFPFCAACARLLADPAIIKAGVAIGEDMAGLARMRPFTPAGIVDLGSMAKRNQLPNQGLRTLAASLFGWRISKGPQCSNWSVRELSPRQITYAATDAWIGRLIYLRFAELGFL